MNINVSYFQYFFEHENISYFFTLFKKDFHFPEFCSQRTNVTNFQLEDFRTDLTDCEIGDSIISIYTVGNVKEIIYYLNNDYKKLILNSDYLYGHFKVF